MTYRCEDCRHKVQEPTTKSDDFGIILCDDCGGNMEYVPDRDIRDETDFMFEDYLELENSWMEDLFFNQ